MTNLDHGIAMLFTALAASILVGNGIKLVSDNKDAKAAKPATATYSQPVPGK